jgi:glutathione S-transferase
MKLYIIPGACSLAVNIALREAQIPFDLARLDLPTMMGDGGADYRRVNPKGYVPALRLDDGGVLTETVAVLQTWPI